MPNYQIRSYKKLLKSVVAEVVVFATEPMTRAKVPAEVWSVSTTGKGGDLDFTIIFDSRPGRNTTGYPVIDIRALADEMDRRFDEAVEAEEEEARQSKEAPAMYRYWLIDLTPSEQGATAELVVTDISHKDIGVWSLVVDLDGDAEATLKYSATDSSLPRDTQPPDCFDMSTIRRDVLAKRGEILARNPGLLNRKRALVNGGN